MQAQNIGVRHLWGKSIGKAQNDRDFLIYNAFCIPYYWDSTKIYIVGKAESGTGFELKQGENTYFHAKDDYTDAFISCLSPEGEILWSTYLPALEKGYYNAFATIVQSFDNEKLFVMVNSYAIQGSIEKTKSLIPACQGKLNYYVFSMDGKLLLSKSFTSKPYSSFSPNPDYLPLLHRMAKSWQNLDGTTFYFSGITYFNTYNDATFVHSMASSVWLDLNNDFFNHDVKWFFQNGYATDYNASALASIFPILQTIPQTFPFGCYNAFSLLRTPSTGERSWKCTREPGGLQAEDKFSKEILYSPGEQGYNNPVFRERWQSVTQGNLQYYADPINTYILWKDETGLGWGWGDSIHKYSIFPGTVQNIGQFNRRYLVQGIHCHNYNNGFFKKDGKPYAYSHDTAHLIPKTGGFYQKRNNAYATVPYLLLYNYEDLAYGQNNYNYKTPLWGSYLNADWMYEDFFHITDSAQRKDIYQPYEPVLLSNEDDRFFLIGNAKSIGNDLIGNLPMTEEELHHQGVVLAFSVTDCPPETTAFQSVRYLCPDGSVELKHYSLYDGFKFRFDNSFLSDGSIVLNADSTRAWAKKEGLFSATLDGSALGCPDVSVDPIRISLSPHPEPVSALNSDSTIMACAAADVVLQAVTEPHRTFSYHWFDDDSDNPKTVRFNNDSLFFASVEVSGYCTSFRDSIRIRFLPPYVNLGKDSLLCTYQTFADTCLLLLLSASQGYFPDADWIFRWQINGVNASDSASLPLRYADLQEKGIDFRSAFITVSVSLSDAADADGCTAYDTLVFSLASLPAPTSNRFLPQSKILCAHQDLKLLLPDTADNYRCFWLDQDGVPLPYGHDTNRFTVTGMRGTDGFGANTDTREPRFFQLRLDHKLCGVSFFDTLLVYDQVKPAFELPCHDTVICLNEPIELDSLTPFVYRPFYAFEWNEGTKGSGYTFTDSGLYILRFFVLEDFAVCGYGTASDTIQVRWSDPAQTLISLPSDTSFCENLSVTLDATVPFSSTRYSWQEGNLDDLFSPLDDSSLFTSPVIKVDKSVSLALFVLDTMGCVNTRQIEVTEEDCKPSLSVPNVFTPNGDGVNDVLKFKQLDQCYDVDILIVDRKGSHVLHQKLKNPDSFAWNGCLNNGSRKLPDGAYFYFISYKNAYGKKKYQSGSITILGSRE